MNRFLSAAALTLAAALAASAQLNSPGAVFTMDNAATGNRIAVFNRASDGTLTWSESVPTGGRGSGNGLGNQGGVVLNEQASLLFAVNAGSDEISTLAITPAGLRLADKAAVAGRRPISIAVHRHLVYVANAGGAVGDADTVSGFWLSNDGRLTPIDGSVRALSVANAGPGQIGFNSDGTVLIVTEKNQNALHLFQVGTDGRIVSEVVHPSVGQTPFGFAFGKRDQLFVSEAFGGATDASATSSYNLSGDGILSVISPSVPTQQTSACWLIVTRNGRMAFTTNPASDSISSYLIAPNGSLTLLEARAGVSLGGPFDMTLSEGGHYLYALNSGGGSISVFKLQNDGSLLAQGIVPVSPGSSGLAAH